MASSDDPPPRLTQGELAPGEVVALAESDGSRARVGTAGFEVRVPGGVPGDRGLFRITHVGKNAAWGRIHQLETPSPDRVDPPCELVDRCGGCPWQMVSLPAQRRARAEALHALLDPLAPDATWHEGAGPELVTGYRTRALMMARRREGRLELGFYAPGSNDLVAVDRCVVQHPELDRALRTVRAILDRSGLSTWDGPERPGVIRAVMLRMDPSVGRGLLTLVVTRDEPRLHEIARDLLAIPGVVGVFANINPRDGGPVLGEVTIPLGGADRQRVTYGELGLEVGPTAFLQTHHQMAETLVARVVALMPRRMEQLADLYAGVGVFGLALRHRAARVVLAEAAPDACADARGNTAHLGTRNVMVIEGALADTITRAMTPAPDAVIVDPPRRGLDEAVVAALEAPSGPRRLVYVSCGPRALARDLTRLVAAGYAITDVVPLDMFPHTPHAEVVVAASRQ
ncbi:MAG: 23S rRNA (uracil(1939)-C(5))-methyltransferase RlmD [Deltaproteobacteria bacterium]|nr:23S rRNA (uracil(1939)-C(5))-methyltransferase RlmD [Deltaproteobacteria bacterium]MCB9788644.1 23S rRNA (uracil(1939)-C(5))-methyltransferase RlmD [Deltaproteobacteria bacterium]